MHDFIKSVSMLLVMSCFITLFPQQSAKADAYIYPLAENIRYVRDSISEDSSTKSCRWTEIQVFSGPSNIALGKSVTISGASEGARSEGDISQITDGVVDPYKYFSTHGTGNVSVTVDLGANYNISEIKIWHYYGDNQYNSYSFPNPKTEVSSDGVNWDTVAYLSYQETAAGLDIYRGNGSVITECTDGLNGVVSGTINTNAITAHGYRVFRKNINSNDDYISIPIKQQIKVLNIYPDVDTSKLTTFVSSADGQSYTLPISAAAKQWMEESTSTYPKGFGNGLITMDSVPLSAFDKAPDSYLKSSTGAYKYDAIYFGAYYGGKDQDISETTVPILENYIKAGYGVLFGRNVIYNEHNKPRNFNLLRSYANIKLAYGSGGGSGFNPKYSDINSFDSMTPSYLAVVKRKELITEYPWHIADAGGSIQCLETDSSTQLAQGDVWIGNYWDSGVTAYGTHAYLTTWGNVGAIQIGDSNCNATEDEKRVLTNALFYVAQCVKDYKFTDVTAKDTSGPYTYSSGFTHDDTYANYTVTMKGKDTPTYWEYITTSVANDDGTRVISNYCPEQVSSGLKGFYVSLSQSAYEDFRGDKYFTNADSYTFTRPSWAKFYIHAALVDNAGNLSYRSTWLVNDSITVTHPISVGYSIDPNSDQPFVADDIAITNKSSIPVKVSVQSFSASSGGDIRLNDVSPQKYDDWTKLNLAQTKDIALGLKIKENKVGTGTWSAINKNDTLYAADVTGKQLLGTLNPNGAKGTLSLSAKFGMAWDKNYNVTHNLSFVFDVT